MRHENMKFDDILTQLGEFGKYQRILYVVACVPMLFIAMQFMSPIFILAIPKHRCAIPGLENDTFGIQSVSHRKLVQLMIPTTDDGEYSKCQIFTTSENLSTLAYRADHNVTANKSATECSSWVYDTAEFESTIVTEADLVCSRTILHAHATTATNIGALFGTIVLGQLSERFGRKLTCMVALFLLSFSSIFMIYLPHIYVCIANRFILGIGLMTFFNICFAYVLEFIGPSRRLAWGIFVNNVWAIGELIHAGLTYSFDHWRHLQLSTSLSFVIILLYWKFLPESPRWLLSKQKTERGREVIQKMSQVNRASFDLDKLNTIDTSEHEQAGNICDVFRSRTLVVRCGIVAINWFVVNMLYYGLSLNIGNLGGSIHLNYMYSSLTEFAAYLLCIPAIYKMGRKRFHCSCMVLSGVALLLTPVPLFYGSAGTEWTITLLSMIGKLMTSAAYATIILYTNELFPTVVRNTVVGMSVFCSEVGGIAAPYLVELANLLNGRLAHILPMMVFGVCSLSAGLLALCLPETTNTQLPDTIEDAKNFGKSEKISSEKGVDL